jgi:hypothetical protein
MYLYREIVPILVDNHYILEKGVNSELKETILSFNNANSFLIFSCARC